MEDYIIIFNYLLKKFNYYLTNIDFIIYFSTILCIIIFKFNGFGNTLYYEIFDNNIIKLSLLGIIVYISNKNILIGLLLSILYCIIDFFSQHIRYNTKIINYLHNIDESD